LLRALARYPVRHWRGELSPGVSWWLNCVLLTVAVWFGGPRVALALGVLDPDTALRFTGALAVNATVAGLVPLWQLVGLWRSAARRVAADGAPGRWSRGRWGQVAGVVFTAFVAGRGLTAAAESAISARVAYAIGPYAYSVRLLPGGREIELRGGIGFGVARELAALADASPGVRRVRLNSGGGALSEARRLRDVIAARRLDTITTTGCSSACVSAFIGGRFRYLQRGAPMGLHLPRNWQPLNRGGVNPVFVGELAYFQQRGVPGWFLAAWIGTGTRFWYPDEFTLLRAGIADFLRGPPPRRSPAAPVVEPAPVL
jgi:hypothetical protein